MLYVNEVKVYKILQNYKTCAILGATSTAKVIVINAIYCKDMGL